MQSFQALLLFFLCFLTSFEANAQTAAFINWGEEFKLPSDRIPTDFTLLPDGSSVLVGLGLPGAVWTPVDLYHFDRQGAHIGTFTIGKDGDYPQQLRFEKLVEINGMPHILASERNKEATTLTFSLYALTTKPFGIRLKHQVAELSGPDAVNRQTHVPGNHGLGGHYFDWDINMAASPDSSHFLVHHMFPGGSDTKQMLRLHQFDRNFKTLLDTVVALDKVESQFHVMSGAVSNDGTMALRCRRYHSGDRVPVRGGKQNYNAWLYAFDALGGELFNGRVSLEKGTARDMSLVFMGNQKLMVAGFYAVTVEPFGLILPSQGLYTQVMDLDQMSNTVRKQTPFHNSLYVLQPEDDSKRIQKKIAKGEAYLSNLTTQWVVRDNDNRMLLLAQAIPVVYKQPVYPQDIFAIALTSDGSVQWQTGIPKYGPESIRKGTFGLGIHGGRVHVIYLNGKVLMYTGLGSGGSATTVEITNNPEVKETFMPQLTDYAGHHTAIVGYNSASRKVRVGVLEIRQ